jgi:hypothetical protein
MLRILEQIIPDPKQDPDPKTAEKDPDLKKNPSGSTTLSKTEPLASR